MLPDEDYWQPSQFLGISINFPVQSTFFPWSHTVVDLHSCASACRSHGARDNQAPSLICWPSALFGQHFQLTTLPLRKLHPINLNLHIYHETINVVSAVTLKSPWWWMTPFWSWRRDNKEYSVNNNILPCFSSCVSCWNGFKMSI